MNIAFVIPYFYPALEYGGQPRSAYELARALVRRGHRVNVLTTDAGGAQRLTSYANFDGMKVSYYPNVSNFLAHRYRLFWPPQMFKNIERDLGGADIVHIHELRNTVSVCGYRAVRRLSLPYVLSTHGGLKHLGRKTLKVVYDRAWGKSMLRDASAVIAVSPIEEQDALAARVTRDRIRRLPNVIPVPDYENLPEPGAFRRRWGITSEKMVLFLGRLHRLKGADLLVEAFQALSRQGTHLVLAGPNDGHEPYLRRLVSRLGLDLHVTFTGFLDHTSKLEALADSSVVVVPSRSEVFAITAGEALMCCRPVLLSSACGFHPLPEPAGCLQFFRSEDVDDLAQKLHAMLYDDSARQHAEECRSFVAREFSAESVARQAETIYEEVLQRWQPLKSAWTS